jgi:hypothetical protein
MTTPAIQANLSNITSVAAAAGTQQLLAANGNRANFVVYNDSTAILYLSFDGAASTTHYTVQVPAQGYFEHPAGAVYTGIVTGVWSAVNGNARITELT